MSKFEEAFDAMKRVTGRVILFDCRPEFNNDSTGTSCFDPGSLDAPEMLPAGSCRAPKYDITLKFISTGATR